MPWLAIKDQHIREKIIRIAPEVLFEGRDPSVLPKEVRTEIIQQTFARINAGGEFDPWFDTSRIRGFVLTDIEDVIIKLFKQYRNNRELLTLLLRFVWHAKLTSCNDLVYNVVFDPHLDNYGRKCALQALEQVGTEEQIKSTVNFILKEDKPFDQRSLATLINCFSPEYLDIETVLTLLDEPLDSSNSSHFVLEYALSELVIRLQSDQLIKFLNGLKQLLEKPQSIVHAEMTISATHTWLLKYAAKICERLILLKNPFVLHQDCLTILAFLSQAERWGEINLRELKLEELIPKWPELNRALFWSIVSDVRQKEYSDEGKRLTDWWYVSIWQQFWSFSNTDFDYLLAQINMQEEQDNKLVALSLAYQIYRENNRPRQWYNQLKRSVAGNDELVKTLNNSFHPDVPPLIGPV